MKCAECGFDNAQTDICSQCGASLNLADVEAARLRAAVDLVLATFKKDEQDGYRSRDRQFAIAILDKAIDPDASAWLPTEIKQ